VFPSTPLLLSLSDPITYFSSSPERPICAKVAADILLRPLRRTGRSSLTAAESGGFSLAESGGSFSLAGGGAARPSLSRRLLAMRAAVAAAVGAADDGCSRDAEGGCGCFFSASAKENCLQNNGGTCQQESHLFYTGYHVSSKLTSVSRVTNIIKTFKETYF